MTDNQSSDPIGPVRPYATVDQQIVPGGRVEQGQERDTGQGQPRSLPRTRSEDKGNGERRNQKDGKKLRVTHPGVSGRRPGATVRRILRGYQQGVVAAVPAAVLAHIAAILAGWPTVLEVPAERLMEWTPVPVASFLLLHASTLARPAALLGALALVMLAGGLAGACAEAGGSTGFGRMAGLALAAAVVLECGVVFSVTSPAGSVFVVAYLAAMALFGTQRSEAAGRRWFLHQTAIILGGAFALLVLWSVQPLVRAAATRRLFPYRSPPGLPISGITDLVTQTPHFYVMDKVLQYPDVGPPGWRLGVDGLVAAPLRLDFRGLLGRRSRNRYITLECVDNPVGGPLISNALWTGVALEDVLTEAGAVGDTVVFHAADGYQESLPRHLIEGAGAVIAYAVNGELLPRSHGYPARLIVPGHYGFKSVKWLTRLEVVRGARSGEWHSHGWTDTGSVRTTTRIDVARRARDEVLLAGIAFAGSRGIRSVEVRVNGGRWRKARLGRRLSRDSWVQWALQVRTPSPIRVEVRAVDGLGHIQIAHPHDAYPDGSTGWASVTI